MPGLDTPKSGLPDLGTLEFNSGKPEFCRHPEVIRSQSMDHWVYILASKRNGTLYVGVTRDLPKRSFEHKSGLRRGFTSRYGVTKLVFAEPHASAVAAIQREKNIKHWPRKWKLDLIERDNPNWDDLYNSLV
jgi:putative endonuclease